LLREPFVATRFEGVAAVRLFVGVAVRYVVWLTRLTVVQHSDRFCRVAHVTRLGVSAHRPDSVVGTVPGLGVSPQRRDSGRRPTARTRCVSSVIDLACRARDRTSVSACCGERERGEPRADLGVSGRVLARLSRAAAVHAESVRGDRCVV
jgi:hypothetical protein